MAQIQKKQNRSKKTKGNPEYLIQHIDIRQINRSTVDIDKWRSAIRSAESVVNPNRRQLYELYSDMMLDGRLFSVVEKRIGRALNTKIEFSEHNKTNENINKLLKSKGFKKLIRYIIESRLHGYSLISIDPDLPNNKITTEIIDRRHVKPEKSLVVKNSSDMIGIDYTKPPLDYYHIGVGDKKDLGIILPACQYVIYKRGGFGDWAQFAEVFGMPFRKGTYDGYDDSQRKKLEAALKAAGSAPWMVLPEGTDVEIIQNTGNSGSNSVYKDLRNACNEEIATIILGNTLTTTQGEKGARSLGDIHIQSEEEIQQTDRELILQVLNDDFLPFLKMHGWKVANGEFSIPVKNPLTKKERIDFAMKLREKQPIEDDFFYSELEIPKPKNYDTLKKELEERNKQKLEQREKEPDDLETSKPNNTKYPKNLWENFVNFFS